jgi:hypothetical protein
MSTVSGAMPTTDAVPSRSKGWATRMATSDRTNGSMAASRAAGVQSSQLTSLSWL